MSLFNKNPNENAFVGEKKHWTDVIKNSGAGELLIWKQPEEDFNTNSTLIVMPGEEAVFIKGGNIEQVFQSGTYKLTTENYPFISRIKNAFSGGISTFSCVVYFVRKAHSMEIMWGTKSPIQVRDPIMMIATSVRAHGALKIQVDDSGKLLTKMIGNNVFFETQSGIMNYFDSEFQQHIKSSIARVIINAKKEILGICAEQDILSNEIFPILQEILDNYGLKLVVLSIAGIDIPENDPSRQKLEDAFASKGVMNILGQDWERQQATEIMHGIAENPNGGIAGAGAGLGLGMAAGGMFGEMAGQVFGNNAEGESQQQPNENQNPVVKIKQLKEMLNLGVITQEDFDNKKQEILSRM